MHVYVYTRTSSKDADDDFHVLSRIVLGVILSFSLSVQSIDGLFQFRNCLLLSPLFLKYLRDKFLGFLGFLGFQNFLGFQSFLSFMDFLLSTTNSPSGVADLMFKFLTSTLRSGKTTSLQSGHSI